MDIWLITILLFGLLLLCLALGLPLAFAFGGIAVLFSMILWGPQTLVLLPLGAFEDSTNFILIAVPLFVFMANILENSGVAEDLYEMMYRWMGSLSGGLSMGTVVICAIFAAMAGLSGVGTITMGLIALPSMLKRGYDKRMAVGCVSAGGTLGILIPPSVIMILYAYLCEESVGRLFIAGIIPGIILSLIFILYIGIRCWVNPHMGPPIEETVSMIEKLRSLKAMILPVLLIIVVLGVIYAGICTPTEAAAVGAGGSIICAVINGRFSMRVLGSALRRTMSITSFVIWILIGAGAFTKVYTALGAPDLLNEIIAGLHVSRGIMIIFMMFIFFILGMFMDPAGIIMICTPIFIPIVRSLGFDTIWFGILFVINMEMGYITPPFGFNLFYMKAIVPPEISMMDIYRSIVPFVVLEIMGLLIIVFFPALATWLPSMMMGY
jgi:tripartite ATP-independent transporter DctM subunit